jgi:cyclophilin family peptidyl-prolyl cis-trans isomerase
MAAAVDAARVAGREGGIRASEEHRKEHREEHRKEHRKGHRKTLEFDMRPLLLILLLTLQTRSAPTFFTSPYSLDQMTGKQAVIETDAGAFVIQLLPDAAPNHVGHFIKLARDGAYAGTIFHRVIRYGIIQGGDPLSRDPAKAAQYGTGGLNELRAEPNREKHAIGAVSAVLTPNNPNSAGAQFFVCAADQPTLDGQYTVFGRVVEGIEVVQQISAAEADADGHPTSRITIRSVTIRDTPPEPFVHATAAEMGAYRAILETTKGPVTIEFFPDKAPETVRNFLRLATADIYDSILVHRVVPGFVIQTGALGLRSVPLTASQQQLVHNLAPEFSDTPHVPGIVSMAHGDDPASAQTSFFICTGVCTALDGKYAVFGKVTAGMDVVKAIEMVPVDGETPKDPIMVTKVRIEKKQP